MDISLLEIKNAKCLMIDREWLAGIIPTAELILSGQLRAEKTEKRLQARVTMAASGNRFLMSDTGSNENHGTQVESEEAYLNVIFIEGVVTRNGGACTYGSKAMRNLIMQASDDDDCKGHVLIFDTPGGLSTAVPDFMMAINYAHERNLLVDGVIDGICASAGIYIGAMCDHLYYTSPTDRVGSIGTFAILDVMKNGDVDPSTGEKHYEIYDPESYDKNDWYRELAEEGKQDKLIESLKKDGAAFRNYIKERRPNCKDEHLHGKLFECSEVDGILVDGQRSMQEVFNEVMNHYYSNNKNDKRMKEKFPTLFAALQVEEMQMTEEGAFLNAGLLETLNAAFEAKNQELADAKALADQLTAEKQTLTEQHQAALDELNAQLAAKNEQIANQEQDITAKEETIGNLQNDLKGAQDALATAEQNLTAKDATIAERDTTLAEKDQQIQDLTAQVEELQKGAGAEPQAGAQPAGNGEGAEKASIGVGRYVYNNDLSYEENMRLKDEFEKK